MKRENKNNIVELIVMNLLVASFILLIQGNAFGQFNKPPTAFSKFLKHWSLGANVGRTAFFGDVSLYDEEFNEKMTKEGAWAFTGVISKQLTPVFGISGQLLVGQLSGSNSKSYFVADIIEYSGHITIDFVNILIPDNDASLHPYAKLGMGQFMFSTNLIFNDANVANLKTESKTPEFTFIFGAGAYYRISNSFNINIEMTGRNMNNDQLDGSTNNKKDNDYYSYLSMGIIYNINNVPRDTRYYRRLGMKSPLIRRR